MTASEGALVEEQRPGADAQSMLAANLASTCATLAKVTAVLPTAHWISNIAAMRVVNFFTSVDPRCLALRASHALHWIVAEYGTILHA